MLYIFGNRIFYLITLSSIEIKGHRVWCAKIATAGRRVASCYALPSACTTQGLHFMLGVAGHYVLYTSNLARHVNQDRRSGLRSARAAPAGRSQSGHAGR